MRLEHLTGHALGEVRPLFARIEVQARIAQERSISWNPSAATRGELLELLAVCSSPDWDGYGAEPVLTEAIQEAAAFLADMPTSIAPPEAVAEPDGWVGLSWDNSDGDRLVVSLGGARKLTFAAIFSDGRRLRGSEVFVREIPVRLLEILEGRFLVGRHDHQARARPQP